MGSSGAPGCLVGRLVLRFSCGDGMGPSFDNEVLAVCCCVPIFEKISFIDDTDVESCLRFCSIRSEGGAVVLLWFIVTEKPFFDERRVDGGRGGRLSEERGVVLLILCVVTVSVIGSYVL